MTTFPPIEPEQLYREARTCWRLAIVLGFVAIILWAIVSAAFMGA